jgi:hypothetical protein
MKGNKTAICFLLLGVLLGFTATAPAEAITISFDPVSQNTVLGNPASVDLIISGLGDLQTPSLSTFDLNINFDPTILAFSSATFGDPILGDQLDIGGFGGFMDASITSPGVLNTYEISFDLPSDLDGFQAGNFILASLTFNTLALGNSTLILSDVILGDAEGEPLPASLESSRINVTDGSQSVPEPSTLILIGSGLFALGGKRFFRKHITRNNS